nr:hypothetical protein BaRGS_018666 [Batillaria attramentaria]
MDDSLYTSVDNSTPGSLAALESNTNEDEYAVVDKSKKSNKKSYSQPKPALGGELYAQVKKSRPTREGDVYAQVDKSSKRANAKHTEQNNVANAEDGNYAEVQKPKPDLKPKPALKPKPTCAVKPSPRNSSGSLKTSDGDDEYNALTFQGRNSDTPVNPDAGQLYSHIGSEI